MSLNSTDFFSWAFSRTLGTHTTLSTDPAKKAALLCFTTPQLNTKQRDICRRHPTLMASVAKGAREAVEECQIQFQHRRWNCSSVPDSGTLFDPILKRGKRGLLWAVSITYVSLKGDSFKICLLKPKGFVFLGYRLFVRDRIVSLLWSILVFLRKLQHLSMVKLGSCLSAPIGNILITLYRIHGRYACDLNFLLFWENETLTTLLIVYKRKIPCFLAVFKAVHDTHFVVVILSDSF